MTRPIMLAALIVASGGCATRAMRAQAAALAGAGERLEAETAAFTAARTAVVQLRQRNLVERRAEVAARGQQNAATLAQWRVAGTPERARRLELFAAVNAASEAMYEVRDQGYLWEESVLAARSALAIDRAALHRLVLQLVTLARQGRFIDGVKFYVEYGATVAAQVDAGLAEVQAGVAAAQASDPPPGDPPSSTPPTGPSPLGPGPTEPKPDPPTPTPGPDDLTPGTRRTGDQKDPGTLRGR